MPVAVTGSTDLNGQVLICLFLGGVMALLASLMLFTGELNISSTQMPVIGRVQQGEVISFDSHPGTFSVMLGVFTGFGIAFFAAAMKLWNR